MDLKIHITPAIGIRFNKSLENISLGAFLHIDEFFYGINNIIKVIIL